MQFSQATSQLLGQRWQQPNVVESDMVQIVALLQALKNMAPIMTENAQRCIASMDVSWCARVELLHILTHPTRTAR